MSDDNARLAVTLVAQPPAASLPIVGRQWCFDETMTFKTSHSEFLGSLTLKNTTTNAKFASIKHSLSATQYINPQVEPFAVYEVVDSKTKSQVLTVRRGSHSSKYEVHSGVVHRDDGPQPCLFSVTVKSENENEETMAPDSDVVLFRNVATGDAYEAAIDGHFKDDRVAIVRIRKGPNDEWQPVARIYRPKPKFVQSEYYTIEVAAGMDAMFITIIWMARWGEFKREKPQLKSYSIWSSAPMDLTKDKNPPPPPNPDF